MATQIKLDEKALVKALEAWFGGSAVDYPWISEAASRRDARRMIRAYLKHASHEASSWIPQKQGRRCDRSVQ